MVQNRQSLQEIAVAKSELDHRFLVLALEQLVEQILPLAPLRGLQEVKCAGETAEFWLQRP